MPPCITGTSFVFLVAACQSSWYITQILPNSVLGQTSPLPSVTTPDPINPQQCSLSCSTSQTVYTNRWSHPGHKLNLHACTCMLRLSHHPGPFFCPLPATPVTQKLETGSQRDRLRSGFTSLSSSLPSPCSLLACKLLFGGGYLILFVDPLIIYVSLCHC